MKKIFTFGAIALAALATLGCKQELSVEVNPSDNLFYIYATRENPVTKTSWTPDANDYSIAWGAQDELSVFSTDNPDVNPNMFFYITADAYTAYWEGGWKSLAFTHGSAEIPGTAPYTAIFPYDRSNLMDAGHPQIPFKYEQTASDGFFDSKAYAAVANSDNLNFSFKNIFGLLAIKVGDANVTSVRLKNKSEGDGFQSRYTIGYFEGLPYVIPSAGEPVPEITLTASEGSFVVNHTYYMVVPEKDFTEGAVFSLYNGDNLLGTITTAPGVKVDRAKVHFVPTLTLGEEPIGTYYTKVTNTSDILDGIYLIVYEAADGSALAFNAGLETLDAVGNSIEVTVNNGKILSTEATDNASFIISVTNGTIRTKDEKYIGVTSNSNGLGVSDSPDAYVNDFSCDEAGNAVIAAVFAESTMTLRYNKTSNQTRFRYFKSGQEPVSLYLLDGSGTKPQVLESVAAPTFNPEPGQVKVGSTVSISCETDGATIYYTVDGTTPTAESSVYSSPITVNEAITIKAFASKAGMKDSKVVAAAYTVPTVDFTTIAELNALATTNEAEKSGTLSNVVVSFVPDSKNAIIKDATASTLVYVDGHGYKQGQTFTGSVTVKIKTYNSVPEVTAINAEFTGAEAVVNPEEVSLATLAADFTTYQNAYVKVANLQISGISGQNLTVKDGDASYIVYVPKDVTFEVGDIITAIGTISKFSGKAQIKVWSAADVEKTGVASYLTVDKSSFAIEAAATSVTVNISSNVAWTVSPGAGVTANQTSGNGNFALVLNFAANESTESTQSYTATISAQGLDDIAVSITQAKKPAGNVTPPEEIVFKDVTINGNPLANGTKYADPFNGGHFTITFGGGGNDGKYYDTGSGIRTYGGGTITIASTSNTISMIEFVWDGSYAPEGDVAEPSGYDKDSATWTGSASSVVLTRPSGNGHWRLQSVKVTYSD